MAMRIVQIPVDEIYVPSSKKKDFDEEKVMPLAEEILEEDNMKPIYVRQGKGRYVPISFRRKSSRASSKR